MKMLKVFDGKDYTEDMPVFEKHTVRAIIVRGGRIAMQKSRDGMYKILGGGVDGGESFCDALKREVAEESGLLIKAETVFELGEMLEIRRDRFEPDKKYVCHSYFYSCDVEETMGKPEMTESEIAMGFHLAWATPEEIIEGNAPFFNQPWTNRDTEMVRMLRAGKIEGVRI